MILEIKALDFAKENGRLVTIRPLAELIDAAGNDCCHDPLPRFLIQRIRITSNLVNYMLLAEIATFTLDLDRFADTLLRGLFVFPISK